MPFPYSIRTSVRCAAASSAEGAVAAVAAHLRRAGATVRERPDGSVSFGASRRAPYRHWLKGISEGRVSAQRSPRGVVVTAEATYGRLFVMLTLIAIFFGVHAGPAAAVAMWLWLVGAIYVQMWLALRWHVKKANAALASAAT